MNRAFYGIMGSKMLTAPDGTYTNAVYGFLAILFKVMEDLEPEYMAVAFDLKGPTARHKLYEGYKANRKGMPEELAAQMPMIKDILRKMRIPIIEKQGYEGDDILGTLSVKGEEAGMEVTILSGDRDTFQLASDKVTIRIPRTKMGKTEVEHFDRAKVEEIYGIEPKQLIEVKGLMGDSSDNIPGVPGVGEKTALQLIKQFATIEEIYKALEEKSPEIKGKLKEKLEQNKELAYLSRELGTINLEVPVEETMEDLKVQEWDKEAVLAIFKELKFNRFIERFHLREMENVTKKEKDITDLFQMKEITNDTEWEELYQKAKKEGKISYYLKKKEDTQSTGMIAKKIQFISMYVKDTVYYNTKGEIEGAKPILEDTTIAIQGHNMAEDYVLFKQHGIHMQTITFDAQVAAYDLNPSSNQYKLPDLLAQYLEIDMEAYLPKPKTVEAQMNLFDSTEEQETLDLEAVATSYMIAKLEEILTQKLQELDGLSLFQEIEMPLVEVLGEMQWNGIYVDKQELSNLGKELTQQIETLKEEIYTLCGEVFNINSTKQLAVVLFEKLNLPHSKKGKKGYSTSIEVLEKLRPYHPVIEKILEYRTLVKLNSTYVEGLQPYIHKDTHRIHSYFHQTVTTTGRISSSDPNLQNIPTRTELGKSLRKAFKPEEGYVFIDADYSQIELRVLAHISEDENMTQAFLHGEDIHKQAAAKVLDIPIEEVTKEQRSSAKAVNFGIVYGISDYGLSEQLGVSVKEAKQYIQQYLEKYKGVDTFMKEIVEKAKEQGYVETLFHRRRYIPEMQSSNYMVRQFGARAAMNTPIQGTAADIMKIAMIHVYQELKQNHLQSRILLQIHDELMIEAKEEEKEQVKEILKRCMEQAISLKVPLEVEVSEATNWYDVK